MGLNGRENNFTCQERRDEPQAPTLSPGLKTFVAPSADSVRNENHHPICAWECPRFSTLYPSSWCSSSLPRVETWCQSGVKGTSLKLVDRYARGKGVRTSTLSSSAGPRRRQMQDKEKAVDTLTVQDS